MDSEEYIAKVLGYLPSEMEDREEIAAEIRSTIAERAASGESLWQTLEQLGNPLELAESYLVDEPTEGAFFWQRFIAKIIDLAIPVFGGIFLWKVFVSNLTQSISTGRSFGGFWIVPAMIGVVWVPLVVYPALAEWYFERTLGKQIMGLRVARESGARISLGQAFLRQLPWLLQLFWIDALFALFTEKHQRAAEMLSHTRTIQAR